MEASLQNAATVLADRPRLLRLMLLGSINLQYGAVRKHLPRLSGGSAAPSVMYAQTYMSAAFWETGRGVSALALDGRLFRGALLPHITERWCLRNDDVMLGHAQPMEVFASIPELKAPL